MCAWRPRTSRASRSASPPGIAPRKYGSTPLALRSSCRQTHRARPHQEGLSCDQARRAARPELRAARPLQCRTTAQQGASQVPRPPSLQHHKNAQPYSLPCSAGPSAIALIARPWCSVVSPPILQQRACGALPSATYVSVPWPFRWWLRAGDEAIAVQGDAALAGSPGRSDIAECE